MRIVDKAKAAYFVQDYASRPPIDGVQIVELKRFNDDGGAMTELGRIDGHHLARVAGGRSGGKKDRRRNPPVGFEG